MNVPFFTRMPCKISSGPLEGGYYLERDIEATVANPGLYVIFSRELGISAAGMNYDEAEKRFKLIIFDFVDFMDHNHGLHHMSQRNGNETGPNLSAIVRRPDKTKKSIH